MGSSEDASSCVIARGGVMRAESDDACGARGVRGHVENGLWDIVTTPSRRLVGTLGGAEAILLSRVVSQRELGAVSPRDTRRM